MIISSTRKDLIEGSDSKSPNFLTSAHHTPIDLEWKNLTVKSSKTLKKLVNGKKTKITEDKTILNQVSGHVRHGTFTAVMGPSGCGKTTLLNILSNRTDSKLSITGGLRANSKDITSIESIAHLFAFVQQDDILSAVSTPRELFTFYAKLRLDLLSSERKFRVSSLLEELGLTACADTKVGNELIRGLSGGERKRTSIGVELIANPSVVFLDEPTTGLDSTTALMIIELLRDLARSGRTIVSTIHQPSSEIFENFDNLMLMVRGNIIYYGAARDAVNYFDGIGNTCPMLTNPSDHFMKIMSETGLIMDEMQNKEKKSKFMVEATKIEQRFKERLDGLVVCYKKYQEEKSEDSILDSQFQNTKMFQTSWLRQLLLLAKRGFMNSLKNPLDVMMRFLQYVVMGVLVIILWANLSNDLTGVQDRYGALFMIATISIFISMVSALSTFNVERAIFIREQNSKAYRTSAYFWATNLAEVPFMIIFSLFIVAITYWSLGLNTESPSKFWIAVLTNIFLYFASSGYGVVLSTFIPNLEIATVFASMVLLPFFATAGFFVSWSHIPYHFYEFAYLSAFKYGYQALYLNEFTDLHTLTCTSDPRCQPLMNKEFSESLTTNLISLVAIGIGMRFLAYLGLVLISSPKKAKLQNSEQDTKKVAV